MRKIRPKTKEIRSFIINNLRDNPNGIVKKAADEFGITVQAVHRHLNGLINDGLIMTEGVKRGRKYNLRPIFKKLFAYKLSQSLEEHILWINDVRPLIEHLPNNIIDICEYGFMEIMNNAIEHSGGTKTHVSIEYFPDSIEIIIKDNGIGIFSHIQQKLGLDDPKHSILELSKGKLTTVPESHTGEGIFFTSQMFDFFGIYSQDLWFGHRAKYDVLFEQVDFREGTNVFMEIHPESNATIKEVFDAFTSENADYGFTKTIVPVAVIKYGDENLISRSQARRLLARFEQFKEIVLDFDKIELIGQAFADEIFRVYQKTHPEIHIMWMNTSSMVEKMIKRVQSTND